jgi:anaerobic glycerol-3-phosphate dehydrogenase
MDASIDVHEETHYDEKKQLINDILETAKSKKKRHRTLVTRYRRFSTVAKALVNVLNAVSVSSLIADSPENPTMKYIALGTTSVSTIVSAFSQALGLEQKTESHNSTYLALSDLYRDFTARLLRNHLSSEDLDTLLGELNGKVSLIEDASLI